MRIVRFDNGGTPCHGILDGDIIYDVDGGLFDGLNKNGNTRTLDSVKLLVPLEPKVFYAAGLNYAEHVREQAELRGEEPKLPENPDIGYRANNALIAHNENVVIPANAPDTVQYEGEIVCIVGKTAKNLTKENALSCIMGYTVGNDVSERTWQKNDRTMWRAKNTDTFKPMGPWIETDVDLEALTTTVRVNGKQTIQFPTNNFHFGIETFIAAMTTCLTLHPGDMIWMGTEGRAPNLQHNDVVEVDIDGIGTLQNKFVREGQ
ncbi:MAG: 2-keto-4-pentenoate hydratase [Rhodospirillaceae bacterium]|nr:2-keto-4-pentenoate hydratase [Rhodospirillaceae bacterium]